MSPIRAVGIGPKLGTSSPVDAARRGEESLAPLASPTRRTRSRRNARSVRRFYSWSVPTPRLRAPERRCRAMPCHAVCAAPGYEPTSRERAPVRASPPARIRACVTRVKWRRRKCACDEIDGSVDVDDRTPTATTLPLPHADAIARRPRSPRFVAADRRSTDRPSSLGRRTRRRNAGSPLPVVHGVATRSEAPPPEVVGLECPPGPRDRSPIGERDDASARE